MWSRSFHLGSDCMGRTRATFTRITPTNVVIINILKIVLNKLFKCSNLVQCALADLHSGSRIVRRVGAGVARVAGLPAAGAAGVGGATRSPLSRVGGLGALVATAA